MEELKILRPDEAIKCYIKNFKNTWRVGVKSDGSCFFHSICLAFSKKYRNMKSPQKTKYVKNLRKELAKLFTPSIYEKIKSHYRKIEANLEEILPDYEDLKEQIRDPEEWVGDNVINVVCHILQVNIFIFSENGTFLKFLYYGDYLKRENPSCMIIHVGGVHYELVGIFQEETDEDEITLKVIFNPDDEIQESLFNLL